jgi:hypothetical protein
MMLALVAQSISAGLFWGAIVGGFVLSQGRGQAGVKERAFKWFVGTGLVLPLGFPLIHPNG